MKSLCKQATTADLVYPHALKHAVQLYILKRTLNECAFCSTYTAERKLMSVSTVWCEVVVMQALSAARCCL